MGQLNRSIRFTPSLQIGNLQDSLVWANGQGLLGNVQIGAGVDFDDSTGTLSADGTGGTVTSVGLSASAGFSVSGSPITGAGTLSLDAPWCAGYGTWDDRPDAATNQNKTYFCTNYSQGGNRPGWVYSDGTYWRPVHQLMLYRMLTSTVVGVSGTSEQYLVGVPILPDQLWPGAMLECRFCVSRDNTSNNAVVGLRFGVNGNVSDTLIGLSTLLSSTVLQQHVGCFYAPQTMTSIKKIGIVTALGQGYSTTGNAVDSPISISNLSGALTLGITVQMAGAGTVPTLQNLAVFLS